MCFNANAGANLPVVDVSGAGVSARAAFGEEIIQAKNTVDVAPVSEKKNVVARSAKKSAPVKTVAKADVLRPNRPSSDLWARGEDKPLRMPRMDEIAVLDSEDILPEESLDDKPVKVAQNVSERVTRDEALSELKELRAEIARLAEMQQKVIARARPVSVRTPISGETDVRPAVRERSDSVRREMVPMETEKEVVRRNLVQEINEPRVASVTNDMTKMSPNELKKAFKKTYLSENKHLSTYEAAAASRYDTVSDMGVSIEGFSAARALSEMDSGVRPMEVNISFFEDDAWLSRDNYNLLSETASIVVNNPKRAIQIAIPEKVTHDRDARKLAARRLAIVEQVLRDTGIADKRIIPVLSQRDDDVFVLRIISSDTFESLTRQKYHTFGDNVSKKAYKNMSW